MKKTSLKLIAITSLLSVCLLGTNSFAKSNPLTSPELFAKFSLGFGAIGAAPGGAVGVDYSIGGPTIGRYLKLGGVFQVYGAFGGAILDFDAQLRGQYPIKVGLGRLAVYGILPLGFSLAVGGGGATPGFNFGIIPGVRWFFTDHWGIFTELGFAYHWATAGAPAGVWNIGAAYAF